MASVGLHGGRWRVQIRRRGYPPITRHFATKGAAYAWAEATEADMLAGRIGSSKHTLRDALERYRDEVSPTKGGARWERLRIDLFLRHPVCSKRLDTLTADDMGAWRDDRLGMGHAHSGTYPKPVAGSSVRRELNLWGSVLEAARREWKWVKVNLMADVVKPAQPRARRRGIRDHEIRAMGEHLTGSAGREVFAAFRLGIETAMRAGEMLSLERGQIDLRARVAHLTKTKNGDERDVPLFPAALAIVRDLLGDGRDRLFLVEPATRDALFRKARKAAGLDGFTFHDSRSEGISRLSKRMDILELAVSVGHRDPKSLMSYYRASASEIARRPVGPRTTPKRAPRSSGDDGR